MIFGLYRVTLLPFCVKKDTRGFREAAGFSGFAWPKTALQPETERSLTSEFGTGSGGSRVLWPATEISRF